MNSAEFLLWVRGPALEYAVVIFMVGIVLRLFEIFSLGHKANLAPPNGDANRAGWHTLVGRMVPDRGTWQRAPFLVLAGWIFHLGLFITLLLFVPHILLIKSQLGIAWPGLPTPVVDAIAVVSMVTLVAVLIHRLRHPVLRLLSTFEDYLVWLLTFLPLLTGYMAFHRIFFEYNTLLSIHILSAELLLVAIPFSKLAHLFTLFIARWYNGAIAGYKGVQS